MANIIYYANIIENKPFGKDVQEAIIEGLNELNNEKRRTEDSIITSGDVYEMLSSLRDAGEVQY